LVKFDDLVAAFFLKFIVNPTEDGFDLLKAPEYTLQEGTNKVTKNQEFFEYTELTLLDLKVTSKIVLMLTFSMFFSQLNNVC